MKLLDKLKNAIFEEEEFDEEFQNEEIVPRKKQTYVDEDEELKKDFRRRAMEERAKAEKEEEVAEDSKFVDDIVKQIDVEKTIPKRVDMFNDDEDEIVAPASEEIEEAKPLPKRESRRAPIIFDETDFDEGVEELKKNKAKEIEDEKAHEKTLYGGYRDEKTREKFKPSPNISPVYGLVEVSPVLEKNSSDPKENHVYVPHKQEEVSLDDVRQKAFGNEPYFEEDEDLGLLYEMEKDDKPAVSKVTLGDAEEYFDDLGLEYNVDYTDKKTSVKEEKTEVPKETRSTKNKELTEKVENEIKEETGEIETLDELEITKDQMKPRTAEEIKKIKKVEDADLEEKEEDPDEKNLYDLIDMMYDSE